MAPGTHEHLVLQKQLQTDYVLFSFQEFIWSSKTIFRPM